MIEEKHGRKASVALGKAFESEIKHGLIEGIDVHSGICDSSRDRLRYAWKARRGGARFHLVG